MAALDGGGFLADLVAWQPRTGVLASWLGRVALLGEEQVCGPRWGDEPLILHANPLAWLRASREGAVVLNPSQAAPLLRDVGPLEVATVEEGLRLRAMLSVKPPRIVVAVAGRTGA